MKKEEWLRKGYVDEPVEKGTDLKNEIRRLCKEKNAVILGHFYQADEIQEIADFVGDSLALAQWAAKTDASIIVMCGVHFMGETAKILCPEKKVLIPDLNAGCSLADSCPADKFAEFVKEHPDHTVISYVNTSAAVKAVTDIVVTSTNAKQIVDSLPADEKIIFGPDRNLGNYINSVTGRDMLLWNGACHVHEKFSVEKIIELKRQYPDAAVLVHPECKNAVAKLADKVASTAGLLKYAMASDKKDFIVATESGILFEMRRKCPDKNFIPAPPEDSTCACNECNFMRLNTLEKLYNTLKYEWPEVQVDENIAKDAIKPIRRMLENAGSPYLCIVFFIVLDLRLTKVGVQRYSFFYACMRTVGLILCAVGSAREVFQKLPGAGARRCSRHADYIVAVYGYLHSCRNRLFLGEIYGSPSVFERTGRRLPIPCVWRLPCRRRSNRLYEVWR